MIESIFNGVKKYNIFTANYKFVTKTRANQLIFLLSRRKACSRDSISRNLFKKNMFIENGFCTIKAFLTLELLF